MEIRKRYTYIPKLAEFARQAGEHSFLARLHAEVEQLRADHKKMRAALAQHEPDGDDPNNEISGEELL